MSWFPVDDAFHGHPKARRAGFEAIGLWTVAGSYCMAYLTDGFVPEWFVKEKPKGLALAKRLITAELWRPSEKDGEQGFQFHDWKPECTKAHVMAMREAARLRKAKQRESHRESRGTDDVTHASVPSTTQPNPTQPINPLVDSGGVVTQVEPPEKCPRHVGKGWVPEACPDCAALKRAHDAWKQQQDENQLAARRRAKEIRDNCRLCHGTNQVEIDDAGTVRKCNHEEAM